MVTDKIKELQAARAKLAALEQSIATERNQELAGLPARFGFPDTEAFISAVEMATGGVRKGNRGRPKSSPKSVTGPVKRRKRAKITDEVRAEVKKLVGEGKTGAEISKSLGISLPSVQNIKKAFGLVRKKRK